MIIHLKYQKSLAIFFTIKGPENTLDTRLVCKTKDKKKLKSHEQKVI